MSYDQVKDHVLEVVRTNKSPVSAKELFQSLGELRISKSEGRLAILDLVDDRQLQITSDRKVAVKD